MKTFRLLSIFLLLSGGAGAAKAVVPHPGEELRPRHDPARSARKPTPAL